MQITDYIHCIMEETHEISENEEPLPHTLKWYPFYQYFTLGALLSCADISHIFDLFSVEPSKETKTVFENAADVVHGMDTWVLVTILIGKCLF